MSVGGLELSGSWSGQVANSSDVDNKHSDFVKKIVFFDLVNSYWLLKISTPGNYLIVQLQP